MNLHLLIVWGKTTFNPSVGIRVNCSAESLDISLSQYQIRDIVSLARCVLEISKLRKKLSNNQTFSNGIHHDDPFSRPTTKTNILSSLSLDTVNMVNEIIVSFKISSMNIYFRRLSSIHSSFDDESFLSFKYNEIVTLVRIVKNRSEICLPVQFVIDNFELYLKQWFISDPALGLLIFSLPSFADTHCMLPWANTISVDTDICSSSLSLKSSISQSLSHSSLVSALSISEDERFAEFEKHLDDDHRISATNIIEDLPCNNSNIHFPPIDNDLCFADSTQTLVQWNFFDVVRPNNPSISFTLSSSSQTSTLSDNSTAHCTIKPIQAWFRSLSRFYSEISSFHSSISIGVLSELRLLLLSMNQESFRINSDNIDQTNINNWFSLSILPINVFSINSLGGYLCMFDEIPIKSNTLPDDNEGQISLIEESNIIAPVTSPLNNHQHQMMNVESSVSLVSTHRRISSGVCFSFESLSVCLDPPTSNVSRHLGFCLSTISAAVLLTEYSFVETDANPPADWDQDWVRCIAPFSLDGIVSMLVTTIDSDTEMVGEIMLRLSISSLNLCFNQQLSAIISNIAAGYNSFASSSPIQPLGRRPTSRISDAWLQSSGISPKHLLLLSPIVNPPGSPFSTSHATSSEMVIPEFNHFSIAPSASPQTHSSLKDEDEDQDDEGDGDRFYDTLDVRDAVVADLSSASLQRYWNDRESIEKEKLKLKEVRSREQYYEFLINRLSKIFSLAIIGVSPSKITVLTEMTIWQILIVVPPRLLLTDSNNSTESNTSTLKYGLAIDLRTLSIGAIINTKKKCLNGTTDHDNIDNTKSSLDNNIKPLLETIKFGFCIDSFTVDALESYNTLSDQYHRSRTRLSSGVQKDEKGEKPPNDDDIYNFSSRLKDECIEVLNGTRKAVLGSQLYTVCSAITKFSLATGIQPRSRKPPDAFWDTADGYVKLFSQSPAFTKLLSESLLGFRVLNVPPQFTCSDSFFDNLIPLQTSALSESSMQESRARSNSHVLKTLPLDLIKRLKLYSLVMTTKRSSKDAFILTRLEIHSLLNSSLACCRCWLGRFACDARMEILFEILSHCNEFQAYMQKVVHPVTSLTTTTPSDADLLIEVHASNEHQMSSFNEAENRHPNPFNNNCAEAENRHSNPFGNNCAGLLIDLIMESIAISGFHFDPPPASTQPVYPNDLFIDDSPKGGEYLRYPVPSDIPFFTAYSEYTRLIAAVICKPSLQARKESFSESLVQYHSLAGYDSGNCPDGVNLKLTSRYSSYSPQVSPPLLVSRLRQESDMSVLPEISGPSRAHDPTLLIDLGCLEIAIEELAIESHLKKITSKIELTPAKHSTRLNRFSVFRITPPPSPAFYPIVLSFRTVTDNEYVPLNNPLESFKLLRQISFSERICAVYCGIVVSNASIELPWDFFLIGGKN